MTTIKEENKESEAEFQSVRLYKTTLERLRELGIFSESYDTLTNRLLDIQEPTKAMQVIKELAARLQEATQAKKLGRKPKKS